MHKHHDDAPYGDAVFFETRDLYTREQLNLMKPTISTPYRPDLEPEAALYESIWETCRAIETLHLRIPAKRMMQHRAHNMRLAFLRCFPARTPSALFPRENTTSQRP